MFTTAAATLLAGQALAQEAAAPAAAGAPAVVPEVVVTGSRIVRRDFTSDSPIVTVQPQALANTAQPTVDNMLARLPQFGGGAGSGAGGTGQTASGSLFGNAGLATLNLRNLGDNRNLVLLDGRRLQPSATNFAVDVNVIPVQILDNVEVITGGASAVYGSDAISGVVNFKLKHNFEGLQFDARVGTAEAGDYNTQDYSVVGGVNAPDGKGNTIFALSYTNRSPVFQRNREFFQRGMAAGIGSYSTNFLATGVLNNGAPIPGNNIGINSDNTPFVVGTGAGYNSGVYPNNPLYTNNPGQGVKYNANYFNFATTPLERFTAFGRTEYEIAPNIRAYAQGIFANYQVKTRSQPGFGYNFWDAIVPIDATHPVPAAILAALPAGATSYEFGRTALFAGYNENQITNRLYQLTGGVNGKLPFQDWTFDAYVSHGETTINTYHAQGTVSSARVQQLLSAPFYGANFNNGAGATCTSGISPYLQGPVSQDCINYVTLRPTDVVSQTQDMVEATVQGRLMALPAGDLRFAVGADWRRNNYSSNVDPIFNANPRNCPVCADPLANFYSNSTSGSTRVSEVYGELLVPLLKDLPFIESFEADLAYRYSDYNTAGGNSTYMASANWRVSHDLSLRGGYQRSVRAPNPNELFGSPQSAINIPSLDPCVNAGPFASPVNSAANPNRAQVQALCAALSPGATAATFAAPYPGQGTPVAVGSIQGNPNLTPEKADSYTAGLVWRPSFDLPMNSRFTATVDYYNITVNQAIGALTPDQAYQLCFNTNGISNPTYSASNAFCQRIIRGGPRFLPLTVLNTYENQGTVHTEGLDLHTILETSLPVGRLNLDGQFNYLLNFRQQLSPGSKMLDYADSVNAGGAAYFRFRSLLTATYQMDNWSAGLRWKHLPKTRDVSCVTGACAPGTDAYNLVDLFGSINVGHGVQLGAGVDNLLNREAPIVGGLLATTNTGEYDLVGRSYYVSLRAKF